MTLAISVSAIELIRAALPAETPVLPDTNTKVEGTGGVVVEVLDGGPWGSAGTTRTQKRVLHVNVLADRTRDVQGNPLRDDADRRAWAVWEIVDKTLHDVNHEWTQVATSLRANGPTLTLLPDGDGAVLLTATYEVAF
jgi:hypothetical protein